MTVNLSEAKAHLGKYVAQAAGGEVITICERNQPLAELRGIIQAEKGAPLRPGLLKGQFKVPDDFNAPLTEFEEAFYGKK